LVWPGDVENFEPSQSISYKAEFGSSEPQGCRAGFSHFRVDLHGYNIYIQIMIIVKIQVEPHRKDFRADALHLKQQS
jgi:hypothetical protein